MRIYSPKILKISEFFSNFFNPLISFFIFLVYYSFTHFNITQAFQKCLPILVFVILPINFWIHFNVKRGKYSNTDVSNRQQRNSLYLFIFGALIVYLVADYFISRNINLIILFVTILLVLMQLSNLFIKSSMHTAFNIFISGLFFSQSWGLGLIWLFISLLVAITRIILKRHTVKEVISGSVIALAVTLMYLYINIHMQFKI